jgi:hypothetical protein
MTTEREHTHAHTAPALAPAYDDLTPGRASRSAQLDAPAHPIVSALIQRKAARDDNGVAAGADLAIASAASSSGSALPDAVMRKFESSLGADLSSVRVHTGAASEAAAHAVGAKAYTMGQDIHFGAGHYDPSGSAGQHLLAHEVAHTVQQRGGAPARQNKLEVSAPGDSFEHEADRAADAMVTGAPAVVSAASGLSRHVVARGIATAYSKDKDLKQLPPAPSFAAADGSFSAMAKAVAASMKGGDAASVPAPTSGFSGSTKNLILCRDHAESSQVFYSTNLPSKYNPFSAGNFNAQYAASAKADATWAIAMLANVSVAGAATESWVSLVNSSNKSWADLVKQADTMCIEVGNKTEKDVLGQTRQGDQQINKAEVGGAAMGLGVEAKKMGLKAPDTSAYKKAMQDYSESRNELVPEQQRIIVSVIPTNLAAIKNKVQDATDEKEKWETVASATATFEQGLTIAFGAGTFVEGGVGALKTTEEGVEAAKGFHGIEAQDAAGKATGLLAKGIEIRIAAIQKQIDAYNSNLGNYTAVDEANKLKADVGAYKNGLVKLKNKAENVDREQKNLDSAFKEFGKSVDEAMIKQGKAAKGSDNNVQAAALFSAIRTASASTQGAVDGLSSGGAGDLPGLYGELAKQASDRTADQTAGNGRRDARSAVFGIESGRWSTANRAIAGIGGDLTRRQTEISALEREFLTQFGSASGGTDSIK